MSLVGFMGGIARILGRLLGRVSRILYILLITLTVVLIWLLFTTPGAQWLAERAMAEEERLQLTVTGGNLWGGLVVESVVWRDEGIRVETDRAQVRWNPLCLAGMEVCLRTGAASGVRVEVDTERLPEGEETVEPEPPAGEERISLPVSLSFPDVRVQQVQIRVDDVQVRWRELRLGGRFAGDRLDVRLGSRLARTWRGKNLESHRLLLIFPGRPEG